MEVGEIWAYRRSAKDPLAEVRVLRIGIKKPLRVKVRFEDYEAEEVEEWVPPARLRVPWADREGFLAKERRWRAVDDAPFPPSKAELDAAIWALGEFAGGDLHAYGTGSSNTVTIVANVEGLTQKSGLSQAQLESFEHSYWDDGKLVLPWGATYLLAESIAVRNPDAVLRAVRVMERQIEQSIKRWNAMNPWGGVNRQVEESWEVERRSMDLLRKWVGDEQQAMYRQLNNAMAEVDRMDALVRWGISKLEYYGHSHSAATLARHLSEDPSLLDSGLNDEDGPEPPTHP